MNKAQLSLRILVWLLPLTLIAILHLYFDDASKLAEYLFGIMHIEGDGFEQYPNIIQYINLIYYGCIMMAWFIFALQLKKQLPYQKTIATEITLQWTETQGEQSLTLSQKSTRIIQWVCDLLNPLLWGIVSLDLCNYNPMLLIHILLSLPILWFTWQSTYRRRTIFALILAITLLAFLIITSGGLANFAENILWRPVMEFPAIVR